jgi:hypothetical protein
MNIIGIDGLTRDQIEREVLRGAKFVVYPWCVSLVWMSWKRSSDIYFVRAGQHFTVHGVAYLLLSLVMGWWSVWGLFWTPQCLWTNISGGYDLTPEVLADKIPASS